MESVMIRVPLEVKSQLEERAAGRPIHKMLTQDFLNEPDMIRHIDARFKEIEEQLDDLSEQIAGLDQSWWNSFQQHEKDKLKLSTYLGLLASTIAQYHDIPDLPEMIVEQGNEIVEQKWSEHLKKTGLYEENGKVKRLNDL